MKQGTKNEIIESLKYDGLQEAENITGKSYKEDKATESLGFINHIANSQRKAKLLSSVDDTVFSETEEEYLRKVTDFGFKSLLVDPFINEDGTEERLYIMFHYDYSILLVWDTHTWGDDGSWAKAGKEVPPPNRNGGHIYYNWSPEDKSKRFDCTSSGGFIGNGDNNQTYSTSFNKDFTPHILPQEYRESEPKWGDRDYEEFCKEFDKWCIECTNYFADQDCIGIWSGDHDCREALKFNINNLIENGTFIKKWKNQPFLWLLHYMDHKEDGYDHEAITKERISRLPEDVQQIIKGNETIK